MFLKTDPTWSSQIKEIWLWQNIQEDGEIKECGIDLVFEDNFGKDWAVQSKCISPDNDIKKSEIYSFLIKNTNT